MPDACSSPDSTRVDLQSGASSYSLLRLPTKWTSRWTKRGRHPSFQIGKRNILVVYGSATLTARNVLGPVHQCRAKLITNRKSLPTTLRNSRRKRRWEISAIAAVGSLLRRFVGQISTEGSHPRLAQMVNSYGEVDRSKQIKHSRIQRHNSEGIYMSTARIRGSRCFSCSLPL